MINNRARIYFCEYARREVCQKNLQITINYGNGICLVCFSSVLLLLFCYWNLISYTFVIYIYKLAIQYLSCVIDCAIK